VLSSASSPETPPPGRGAGGVAAKFYSRELDHQLSLESLRSPESEGKHNATGLMGKGIPGGVWVVPREKATFGRGPGMGRVRIDGDAI
jgi:hypothetical protein